MKMKLERSRVSVVYWALNLAVAAAATAPLAAHAAEDLGARTVTNLGCHHGNGTCYVGLSGAPFGSSLGCTINPSTQFRFDDGDTAIGRRSYASFLAAYLAGKSVTAVVSGCTSQGYPALSFFVIAG